MFLKEDNIGKCQKRYYTTDKSTDSECSWHKDWYKPNAQIMPLDALVTISHAELEFSYSQSDVHWFSKYFTKWEIMKEDIRPMSNCLCITVCLIYIHTYMYKDRIFLLPYVQ